jgi:hypothetical protein
MAAGQPGVHTKTFVVYPPGNAVATMAVFCNRISAQGGAAVARNGGGRIKLSSS